MLLDFVWFCCCLFGFGFFFFPLHYKVDHLTSWTLLTSATCSRQSYVMDDRWGVGMRDRSGQQEGEQVPLQTMEKGCGPGLVGKVTGDASMVGT